MRPTELSIGDWVLVKNHDYPPMQVLGIVPKSGTLYFYLKPDLMVELDMLEPIPITRETFERNGFAEVNDGYYPDNGMVAFQRDDVRTLFDRRWNIVITKQYGVRIEDDPLIKLTHVHELQHALRLMGVTKEIEL